VIDSQEADFAARTASVNKELCETKEEVASLKAELARVTGVSEKKEKEKAAQDKINRMLASDSPMRQRIEGLVMPIAGQIA